MNEEGRWVGVKRRRRCRMKRKEEGRVGEKRGKCQITKGEEGIQMKRGEALSPCEAKMRREKINFCSRQMRESGQALYKDNLNKDRCCRG